MSGITIKTAQDIEHLKVGGKHLAEVLLHIAAHVKPGVTTDTLDALAQEKIRELGDTPAFLGYKPEWSSRPYPAALCVSINHVVEHGIPAEPIITIEEGDIVSLDTGLVHEGLIVDSGFSLIAGTGDPADVELLRVNQQALYAGIAEARPGNRTGDISAAIQKVGEEHGYGIVTELAGHGVGYSVHEEPIIPNMGRAGTGPMLEAGMVIAIEPMFTRGEGGVIFLSDEYTVITRDKSHAAHFEHTVVITDGDPLPVTWRDNE